MRRRATLALLAAATASFAAATGCTTDATAPGGPAMVTALSPVEMSGRAGEAAPDSLRLQVFDRQQHPVRGVMVRFDVLSGLGSVSAATLATNDSGGVAVAWTFGSSLGRQEVRATVAAVGASVTFGALVHVGPGRVLDIVQGTLQAGAVRSVVAIAPRVRLLDAFGHVVAGVPVSFWAVSGGSSIDGGETVTDANGIATAGSWTLGPCAGESLVEVRAAGGLRALFTATATGGPDFCVAVLFVSPPAPALRQAADSAAARWSRAIRTNFDAQRVAIGIYDCVIAVRPTLRDVKAPLMFVDFIPMPPTSTGRTILGMAGPCLLRPTGFPLAGFMQLNSDYMIANLGAAQIEAVVLHEMGHILGFGTLWNGDVGPATLPVLFSDPPPGGSPRFVGTTAIATYRALPGGDPSATSVPLEPCGPPGTRNGHWSEQVFGDELMTGYLGARGILSKLTIAALSDLGYVTDSTQASPYAVAGNACPVAALQFAPAGSVVVGGTIAVETLVRPTGIVRNGRVEPIVRR